ncbi:N-acetylgalactosamine-6-sulfatase [Allostella sp. ATCC 35155]|nr:N-acetylgalactosamine-6-sulfatase [Stella sp. ATCC 35155]
MAAMPDRPDILVVMTDQQRADTLGCLGAVHVQTPHLDRLAERGVLFPLAFTPVPICSPARASLWTGLYAHQHGVRDNVYRVPDALAVTGSRSVFPDLAEAGYRTVYIGKWHLGEEAPPGIEVWGGYNSKLPHWLGGAEGPKTYRPFAETAQAIDVLERDDGRRPLCMVVSYYPPHPPFDPPSAYRAAHGGAPRPGYFGAVRAIDDCVGRLLDALDRSGRAQRTAVVFCSDHGQRMQLDDEENLKRNLLDETVRIPMILVPPGGLPDGGRRSRHLVGLMDVAPTMRALVGLPAPAGDGPSASLLPLLEGDDHPWRSALLLQNQTRGDQDPDGRVRVHRAVRTADAKLILRQGRPPAIFDLRVDPREQHNLMERVPQPRGPLRRLAERMRQLGADSGDAVAVEAAEQILEATAAAVRR